MTDGPAVAIVVPVLDEAATLTRLARHLSILDPPAAEVIVVDGGSADGTAELARELGFTVVEHDRGRARQINRGVAQAGSELVMVLHADTLPPDDATAVVRRTLADPTIALAGFTPIIEGPERVRWATTFHNWIKTWYGPLLGRPHLFLRGARLLFGDHAMFFRRADFLAVGGMDEGHAVMEEADLCAKMVARGRVRLVNRTVRTSDRRIAEWGEWRANGVYLAVGWRWALGLRARLADRYPDVR